ncbi:MAG: hypothetical protein N2645_24155 [Clostridia bacterium]|nr:hypothetical protein [Clostridia bacterium]
MNNQDLLGIIEAVKKGNLLDVVINDEVYWISYVENEESIVIDSMIDLPHYFESPLQAADYISHLCTAVR